MHRLFLALQDLSLVSNPFSDNRFKKLVSQKGAKAVLDYVRQHFAAPAAGGGGGKKGKGKKGKKGAAREEQAEAADDDDDLCDRMEVLHMREGAPKGRGRSRGRGDK